MIMVVVVMAAIRVVMVMVVVVMTNLMYKVRRNTNAPKWKAVLLQVRRSKIITQTSVSNYCILYDGLP